MHSATVTRDANGIPTGLSGIAEENLLGGTVLGFAQMFDEDKVVIAETLVEKVILDGSKIVVGGLIDKRLVTGEWGIPFKA